ncbi:FAD-binding protein [Henriciella mobilis]|uniref:FAD-binding oxidoreductase n=1 Tax=Henriciella mobilis TaxID=2305467 RepID=A0A399RAE6_9PROT|nr:FAD-binding oxidoreductase [Henriciella mobilis]RIJ28398.1 FAD-binding oxidoreductase [Henriciella mobilis]
MTLKETKAIRSWGGVTREPHFVAAPARRDGVGDVFDAAAGMDKTLLAHGLGRSYGDSCLSPGNVILETRGLDRFIAFDRDTGILRAEAGVSLGEIMRVTVPYGFFPHTTPGTRFVTLGGAVANDVHGKNHHVAGSFGENVRAFGLLRSDRGEVTVTPDSEPELFRATVGGLGMTGIITWGEIQLVRIASSNIEQEIFAIKSLDHFFEVMEENTPKFEHTVAWVDCTARKDELGRGVFTGGNWSSDGVLEPHRTGMLNVPFTAPGFALNPLTLKTFNSLYRWRQLSKAGRSKVPYTAHFHVLDAIKNWNRLYGKRGFFQYQSVIPFSTAKEATREMLTLIAESGQGSMLAVLKTLGPIEGRGWLSFPREGVTLALDFQNKGQKTLQLMTNLDKIVSAAGGRLYPAKDGRISADMFQSGYPDWQRVEALRDPAISSSFWQRVSQS